MIKQTLAFANPAYLSLKNGQLVIDRKGDLTTRHIEDIGLIVIESSAVTITSALMSALLENNTAVVFCDSRHMPSGIITPITSHTANTERLRHQLTCSQPLRKQLWQQTVCAKITNQANLLRKITSAETGCMYAWSKNVRSGDPDNIEARAAIYYWKNIFEKRPDFQRNNQEDIINSMLNYGYAIVRAILARAIVGSGLIPQVGLFHSNKYNAFCLADDLMEPYRPYVDELVCEIIRTSSISEMNTKIKRRLLTIPTLDVTISGLRRPLMIAATLTTSSLAKCYSGEKRKIEYPLLSPQQEPETNE